MVLYREVWYRIELTNTINYLNMYVRKIRSRNLFMYRGEYAHRMFIYKTLVGMVSEYNPTCMHPNYIITMGRCLSTVIKITSPVNLDPKYIHRKIKHKTICNSIKNMQNFSDLKKYNMKTKDLLSCVGELTDMGICI